MHACTKAVVMAALCLLAAPAGGGPAAITDLRENRADYPQGKVPVYGKLEIGFRLSAPCENPFAPFPVDPGAPEAERVDARPA